MCEKIREHSVNGRTEFVVPSESGLDVSDGRIGEPIPSESDAPETVPEPMPIKVAGARVVRHHKGLSDISVSLLHVTEERPGSFVALKREGLVGYTVTLSCDMTSTQYAALISTLETTPSGGGGNVTVGLDFEPMTPNLVQPDTAPSI